MLRKFRERLTFANVVSLIALFVALGGTSVAAVSLSRNSVKNTHIAANAVTSPKVKNASLLAQDFAPGQLPKGEKGDAGAPGQNGAPGRDGVDGQDGAPGQDGQDGLDATAPSGAVMHFDLASCPTGWTELTSARGRYIVGLPVGGTRGAVVGTALSPQEDRPVGQHNHGVTDPGHTHQIQSVFPSTESNTDASGLHSGRGYQEWLTTVFGTRSATTGITVNNAGAVAGTTAPYLQLLVCKKN